MKKQIVFIVIASCILTSCAGSKMLSIMPKETIDEIPVNSNKIVASNNQPKEDNYNNSYKCLLDNDYRIENDNKEMGYISASKMDVGDTQIRLNVSCDNNKITVTSEWRPGSNSVILASAFSGIDVHSDWDNAKWTNQYDKPNIAFAKAVLFLKQLSNNLAYVAPPPVKAEKYWGMEK